MAADPKALDLTIYQGRTFNHIVRWETEPVVFKQITAITRGAPVTLTVAAHGLRSGWRAAVTSAGGMTEINAPANAPKASDYRPVTVIDVNTLSFDIDSTGFSTYTSGGYLRYNTPKSLVGAVARMDIRDRVGGTLLLALSSAGVSPAITLNDLEHTIVVSIPAAATATMAFKSAVYDLEIVSADGTVSVLLAGGITVVPEVTTSV